MIKIFLLVALFCHSGYGAVSSESNETDTSNESISKAEDNSISNESHELEVSFGRRIIGGQTARPGELSFVARLSINFGGRNSLCSGTVLSNRHILTAAHCVYSGGRKAMSAYALIFDGRQYDFVFFSADEMYYNPNYNERFADDIAILKLKNGVMRKDYGAPLLPNAEVLNDIFTNTATVAAGWGKTSDRGQVSSTLQYVNLNTIPNNVCQSYFGSIITPNVICTLNRNKGICGGDSGGPLMMNRGGKTYVIGVNAFGSSQCESYNPSGYTYVLPYMSWIRSVL